MPIVVATAGGRPSLPRGFSGGPLPSFPSPFPPGVPQQIILMGILQAAKTLVDTKGAAGAAVSLNVTQAITGSTALAPRPGGVGAAAADLPLGPLGVALIVARPIVPIGGGPAGAVFGGPPLVVAHDC